MRRREFIALVGGFAAAWPLAARAQTKMPVIGFLGLAFPDDPAVAVNLQAFRQGLSEIGYVEGQNVTFVYRWAHYNELILPALAAELVALKVDVIVTEGSTIPSLAAKRATTTIPIVFHAGDAIEEGLVNNLARPGGNLTGVSLFAPERLSKSFQLLSELVPMAKVIALLSIPSSTTKVVPEIQETARARGVRLQFLTATTDSEIDTALASLGQQQAAAVVLASAPFADKIVGLASRYAVPAVYSQSLFVTAGGLLSYGPSIPAAYVIKGSYAGKILKGEKPSDLPVVQPTSFALAINLKTARMLGLTVPPTLLAQADQVIE